MMLILMSFIVILYQCSRYNKQAYTEAVPVQKISIPGSSLVPMVFKYSDSETVGTARDAQYSVIGRKCNAT